MTCHEIFRVENVPTLQNRVYESEYEAINCNRGEVILVQDSTTGLIYNSAFDQSKLEYDENYQNEQAHSAVFQQHLNKVSKIVTQYTQGGVFLEIGCGKGRFLNILREMGCHVIGVDPAYQGNDKDIHQVPFTPELGLHGDVLIMRHVLEHIPDPVTFLRDIANSNGGTGTIYIEVPCFDWILQNNAWFDIYYEHVNYFRLNDFSRIFGKVHECGHLFGGQYIYVVADIKSIQTPSCADGCEIKLPNNFLQSIEASRKTLTDAQKNNINTVIWGAASKGVLFSLYMKTRNFTPEFAIDINPAKQNHYLPVSGLHIISPADALRTLSPGDIIIVMNSNYLSEIIEQTNNIFDYRTIEK